MEEIWKEIEGFDGLYLISSYGKVKSLGRYFKLPHGGVMKYPTRILKPNISKQGYVKVTLNFNGKSYYKTVHRLVAIAFIPNPENKLEVNHKDGNKSNNNVDSLEWNTCLENHRHASKMGLAKGPRNEKHGNCKVTNVQIQEMKELVKNGISRNKVGKLFNIKGAHVGRILNGTRRQYAT